jgi:hypothetical protein
VAELEEWCIDWTLLLLLVVLVSIWTSSSDISHIDRDFTGYSNVFLTGTAYLAKDR